MSPTDHVTIEPNQAARNSFNGRTATETQLTKAWAIAEVLRAEIQQEGTFRDALTDFSHAFARGEKFDALRGEAILRDVFEGRYGQTLNAYRETLEQNQKSLTETAQARALVCAETIGELIQQSPTQPYYRAHDKTAVTLAGELGVTQKFAKRFMSETFEAKHGKELYAHGKEIEEAYHKPVREAEIAARKAEKLQTHSRSQSMG